MEDIKNNSVDWESGRAKSITFIVTKDCQLACKYCYLVGKNSKERMSWEIAKQAIDYILSREDEFKEESVIWDFIGGEPFLEIDLIDRICDYIKVKCSAAIIIGLIPIGSVSLPMALTIMKIRFNDLSPRTSNI